MSQIIQLRRTLTAPPLVPHLPGVLLRNYQSEQDIERWITLRTLAFARQRPGVGAWTAEDFRRQLLAKTWCSPERMWLAEGDPTNSTVNPYDELLGAVILGDRGRPPQTIPSVHWLMVHPNHRRRGLGQLLLSRLERSAWDAGHRQLVLETHAGWIAAASLYEVNGYVKATD